MGQIGSAVGGLGDAWEEIAVLFADALLRDPRVAELAAIRRDLQAAEAELAGVRATLAGAEAEERRVEAELQEAESRPMFWGGQNPLFWLLLPLVLLPLILRILELGRRNEALRHLRVDRNAVSRKAQEARDREILQAAKVKDLQGRYGNGVPARSVEAVGHVRLTLQACNLAGYDVLVDRSGVLPAVPVTLPDLAADPDAIEMIRKAAFAVKTPPMLLSVEEHEGDDLDALAGEELQLERALATFVELVQDVPTVRTHLRLLSGTSGLLRAIPAAPAQAPAWNGRGVTLASSDRARVDSEIEALGRLAGRLRAVGGSVENVLRSLKDDLKGVFGDYSALRSEALGSMHDELVDAMRRSRLAQVYYYCPKCCCVPAFVYHRLGLPPDGAHALPPVELMKLLAEEPEIATRLAGDPAILKGLSDSIEAIQELSSALAVGEPQGAPVAFGPGMPRAALPSGGIAVLEANRSQLGEAIKTFNAWFRKAVTGSPYPLLSLSRRARMRFDPNHLAWVCPACTGVFPEGPVAEMGRVLRIREELIHPMWKHLWTEKDDLRKAELMATDREIGGMKEKETSALQQIGSDYAADVRMVREHLVQATSEAEARVAHLQRAIAQLEAAGLISAASAAAIRDRSPVDSLDLAALKKHAMAKELVLSMEPHAQVARRPVATDPTDLVLTPGVLFKPDDDGRVPRIAGSGQTLHVTA